MTRVLLILALAGALAACQTARVEPEPVFASAADSVRYHCMRAMGHASAANTPGLLAETAYACAVMQQGL